MKCNICNETNPEIITISPKGLTMLKLLTFGLFKLHICQTCVSKMFRRLDPTK